VEQLQNVSNYSISSKHFKQVVSAARIPPFYRRSDEVPRDALVSVCLQNCAIMR